MKRLVVFAMTAAAILAAQLVVRTMRLPAPPAAAAATAGVDVDTIGAAGRLSGAVKLATVSLSSGGPVDTTAFLALHQYLADSFPRVHASLTREVIGGLSLLYTWRGSDTTLAPVVLMGHFDVVPVTESNLPEWTHGPFSGAIADGFVWGRGTLDDKATVLSILEAVEGLLASSVTPARTVYLTFGHDEEVGGRYGARVIVEELVRRGVKPALVLDEGGFMAEGALPGLKGLAAIVGIGEKGYMSLRLRARADGGHSSTPPARTAVGALSKAIAALEANPFPSRLNGPTRGMMEAMAPYLPFTQRVVLANLWLTGPLVRAQLAGNPLGSALMHTTIAPTMLSAGIKDNVLPPEATAVVNFRIVPGETVASVTERVRGVIADSMITVEPLDSAAVDPSPISDVDSPAFRLIAGTIRGMVPGTTLPVIPYLVMGGTDAKFWGPHTGNAFRFLAVPLGDGDLTRVHGVNERIPVRDYATSVSFFARLIRGLDRL